MLVASSSGFDALQLDDVVLIQILQPPMLSAMCDLTALLVAIALVGLQHVQHSHAAALKRLSRLTTLVVTFMVTSLQPACSLNNVQLCRPSPD